MLFAYTLLHVAFSLLGIASGFVVIWGFLTGKRLEGWNKFFLANTIATSVTGFGFPFEQLMPSHIFGVISLIVLAVAVYARYPRRLAGPWHGAYVITAIIAQYLNVFVLIVQAFLKVPALHDLAPTQSEPPFALAQGFALVAFIVLGALAVRRIGHPPA